MALERRMELKAARLGLQAAQIAARSAANQLRPRLDLCLSAATRTGDHGSPGAMHGNLAGFKNPGYG